MHITAWLALGRVLWGRPGREILGTAQLIFIFVMDSHVLTFVLTLPVRLADLSRPSSISLVHEAFLAITNLVFVYAGHVTLLTLFSELKDPYDYPKSFAERFPWAITCAVLWPLSWLIAEITPVFNEASNNLVDT